MKPLDAKTECPLCRETLDSMKEYRQHVGKHLVDLALFALPKTGDREDSDDYDEMGDDKVVDSSEVDDDNNVDDNDEVTVDNGLDQADELDDQAELCTTERRGRHGMLQTDDSKSIPSKKQMPRASSHYQAKANRAWQCVRITVYFNTRDQIIICNSAPAMVAGSRLLWTIFARIAKCPVVAIACTRRQKFIRRTEASIDSKFNHQANMSFSYLRCVSPIELSLL
ncbi:uncharacterized protein G6M90_00g045540 [Metarhizium brunneum]|uniref:C2H2-type domain-containing protein n=1 Tax=Metarhizium brunneum TaxID=500148 RepID=A0A7D5UU19_9HYPO|nr:hypothetical protein G6M90_00g045540 [Metarhizium brunneum]